MSDDRPSNKVSFFKKVSDMHKPMETIYEIRLESIDDSVDDLIAKAKGVVQLG